MKIDYQLVHTPQKLPFRGIHFSDSDITGGVIHGARRGSGEGSSDTHRLHLGSGAPPAVHVYRHGSVGHPRVSGRKHAHGVSGDYAIADISSSGPERDIWTSALDSSFKDAMASGADIPTAKGIAQNSAERALIAANYDGYESSATHPGSVVLFGDQRTDNVANT